MDSVTHCTLIYTDYQAVEAAQTALATSIATLQALGLTGTAGSAVADVAAKASTLGSAIATCHDDLTTGVETLAPHVNATPGQLTGVFGWNSGGGGKPPS